MDFFLGGGGERRPRLRYWPKRKKNHKNWSNNDRNLEKIGNLFLAGNILNNGLL